MVMGLGLSSWGAGLGGYDGRGTPSEVDALVRKMAPYLPKVERRSMDLKAAQMFVTVVRAGSLSAAALKSGVPLATLSRNIRQLEETLGVQLLERSARGITLTDAGLQL